MHACKQRINLTLTLSYTLTLTPTHTHTHSHTHTHTCTHRMQELEEALYPGGVPPSYTPTPISWTSVPASVPDPGKA